MGGGAAPPHTPAPRRLQTTEAAACNLLPPWEVLSAVHTPQRHQFCKGLSLWSASQSCNSPLCGLQGGVGGRTPPPRWLQTT